MEGILLVPPDRGTIIGRAIWKARYVVVADPSEAKQWVQQQRQSSQTGSTSSSSVAPSKSTPSSRGQQPPARAATPHSPTSFSPESMFLSVFKSKGDWDPIQQHAISSITDCQLQMLAHRKQGPVLPTLVINVSPDPLTDKLRKRRSSRTAGLTTTKETSPTTLWFRPADDSAQKQDLQDWCLFIQSLMLQHSAATPSAPFSSQTENGSLSPVTPMSPTFINPFATSQRGRGDTAEYCPFQQPPLPPQHQYGQRPGSGNNAASRSNGCSKKGQNNTTQTSQTYSSRDRERERPKTYSDSPSLRSRRSDLSHTSSNLPPHVTTPGYNSTNNVNNNNTFASPFFHNRSTDPASPAAFSEYQGDSIDIWTSVKGRSSLSSPVRGRDSISSQPPLPTTIAIGMSAPSPIAASINSSSPPAPRETILDRAFQMRFIPGSDRDYAGEDRLTSLARFEALMQEADERKRLRQAVVASDIKRSATTAPVLRPDTQPKSGWDLDDDSDGSEAPENDGKVDDADDDECIASGDDDGLTGSEYQRRAGCRADSSSLRPSDQLNAAIDIAPSARRALGFIMAGRNRDTKQESSRTPSSKYRGKEAPLDYSAQTTRTPNDSYFPPVLQMHQQDPNARPQTGYSGNRPVIAQRTHSQPQLAVAKTGNSAASSKNSNRRSNYKIAQSSKSPTSPPPLPRSSTSSKVDDIKARATAAFLTGAAATTLDKRLSTSSIKRLSFTDFTKRLSSSTSSLLLVQTNTSSNSINGTGSGSSSTTHEAAESSTYGVATGLLPGSISPRNEKYAANYSYTSPVGNSHQHSNSTSSRLAGPPQPSPAAERCGWRGSVNVISTEGGFV
ncbi:hypothetical protein SEPCBS57363_004489 [Sporothrix epigloea]|uniref:PH domain-containing protein n=1 Tax=Sporothrix epigloea TaxID=1892477 RepID=A0ABP0DW18_9PEZI